MHDGSRYYRNLGADGRRHGLAGAQLVTHAAALSLKNGIHVLTKYFSATKPHTIIFKLLIVTFWLLCTPAWVGAARQLCLSCHVPHYSERGGCVSCHRGNPGSNRKNVAHQRLIAGRFAHFTLGETVAVRQGNRLLEQFGCRRCHVSRGRGNRLATSLDTLMNAKSPEEIASAIVNPALGMPDFRLANSQVVDLVNIILSGAQHVTVQQREGPLLVHFESGHKPTENIFIRKCGSCHRALTERQGLIGAGAIGPDLSGLLSEYYPRSFRTAEAWTPEHLRRWLENPRAVRPQARMLPVLLSATEFRELLDVLAVSSHDK